MADRVTAMVSCRVPGSKCRGCNDYFDENEFLEVVNKSIMFYVDYQIDMAE